MLPVALSWVCVFILFLKKSFSLCVPMRIALVRMGLWWLMPAFEGCYYKVLLVLAYIVGLHKFFMEVLYFSSKLCIVLAACSVYSPLCHLCRFLSAHCGLLPQFLYSPYLLWWQFFDLFFYLFSLVRRIICLLNSNLEKKKRFSYVASSNISQSAEVASHCCGLSFLTVLWAIIDIQFDGNLVT